MASRTYTITQNNETVFSITLDVDTDKYRDYQWDSSTGLVTAVVIETEKREIIPYSGNGLGTLKPGPFQAEGIVSMDYNFWYY